MTLAVILRGAAWAALSLSVLQACSNPSAATPDEEYVLYGAIDAAAYHAFVAYRAAHEGPLSMRVRSAGGDARCCMRLGDAMLAANVELRLNGMCHSACVQYLVPSARHVTIAPQTSIAFHTSPSDLRLPAAAPARVRADLRAFQAAEDSFYSRRGISAENLRGLRAGTEPLCRLSRSAHLGGDLNDYGLATRYSVVVPSRELLEQLGYSRPSGYWPPDSVSAVRNARAAGFGPGLTLRYVAASPQRSEPDELPARDAPGRGLMPGAPSRN